MKHDYTVRAYRTETKYDTRDNLMSLLDVQVPADALEFLRAAHNAQDSKDVTFTVVVVNTNDGDFRRLKFTSKGSKMKDFVPVATLEKWCDPHDNLTALFSHEYELSLVVEVRERQVPDAKPLFEEEGEQPQEADTVRAGVLNAPKETLALPAPDEVQDAEFKPAADSPEAFLARCTLGQLSALLVAVDYDPTDWDDPRRTDDEDAAEWRQLIAQHWSKLDGSEVLARVMAELSAQDELFEGEDMPFGPEGGDAA